VPHTGFNRLKSVAESVANADAKKLGFNPGAATGTAMYAYDANGNMTTDPYKGLGISYNHLNLPTQFTFTPNTNKIDILYDYTGKKLRKTVTTAGVVTYIQDYVGNLEWRKQGTNPRRLEALYHDEGRIVPAYSNTTATTPSSYAYEFSMRDHLGNTRLTFADANADGVVQVPEEINQENHYYPFGMSMGYSWLNNASQDSKYQYNGKELSEEFGLNLMDYGARWYDAQVPHWLSVDPKAETSISLSPYNYVQNNPVLFIDPFGLEIINGHAKDRAAAQDKRDKAQGAVNDFKGDKDSKDFKKLNKTLNQAERNFKRQDNLYQAVESATYDLMSGAQEEFNTLNNLKDGGGREVDVVVKAVDGLRSDHNLEEKSSDAIKVDGLTSVQPNGGLISINKGPFFIGVMSENGSHTASVYLELNYKNLGSVFAHEGGHVIYDVQNMTSVKAWRESHPNERPGGHGIGNPSGAAANKYEDAFKNR
jgi:RHS repeat-associated protein